MPSAQITDYFDQWSPSKIKTLRQCPLKYYLQYIKKMKIETPASQDTTARDAGKALHSILEYMAKGLTHPEAVLKTKMEYKKGMDEWQKYVEPNLYNVRRFVERFEEFSKVNPVEKLCPEVKLGVRRDWSLCDFFAPDVYFRGIVDLTILLKNKDAIVIDHKKGGTAEFGLKNYEAQLNPYKILVLAKFPHVQNVSAGIHFVEEGTVPIGNKTSAEQIIEMERPKLVYDINCGVEAVQELGVFKHKRGSYCKYCDYNEICKAKEYGSFEKESIPILESLK